MQQGASSTTSWLAISQTGGPNESTLTIALSATARTVWTQNHVSPLLHDDGRIDWSHTNRVRLIQIGEGLTGGRHWLGATLGLGPG